jgi:hypothetical protein
MSTYGSNDESRTVVAAGAAAGDRPDSAGIAGRGPQKRSA